MQDLGTHARSCPRSATQGPQDEDPETAGFYWCDEHAPTDEYDIDECEYPVDLPWAGLVREAAALAPVKEPTR